MLHTPIPQRQTQQWDRDLGFLERVMRLRRALEREYTDDSARRKPAGSWWRCTLSRVRPLLASVAVGPREQGEIVLQNIMQVGKFFTHERLGL